MRQHHSPGSQQLAVPGFGYLQNVSFDRNALDLAAQHRGAPWTDEPTPKRANLAVYLAAAFVVLAVAFGPIVVSLL
jgi:hypothetical protein